MIETVTLFELSGVSRHLLLALGIKLKVNITKQLVNFLLPWNAC
jgi:hypothetical protein